MAHQCYPGLPRAEAKISARKNWGASGPSGHHGLWLSYMIFTFHQNWLKWENRLNLNLMGKPPKFDGRSWFISIFPSVSWPFWWWDRTSTLWTFGFKSLNFQYPQIRKYDLWKRYKRAGQRLLLWVFHHGIFTPLGSWGMGPLYPFMGPLWYGWIVMIFLMLAECQQLIPFFRIAGSLEAFAHAFPEGGLVGKAYSKSDTPHSRAGNLQTSVVLEVAGKKS